ncbi:MAG: M24 family metallopeptidase, partial [Candidatus Binataceae bacterium]
FRMSDPLAYRILGIPTDLVTTRRWFAIVPAQGEPQMLVSAVEAHRLDALGLPPRVYRSLVEMHDGLRAMLAGRRRVAMQYSPQCAIPYVARVDAGTIELVRSMGVEVVSSADLVQRFEAVLGAQQLQSHHRAAAQLRAVVDETFEEIARRLNHRIPASEPWIQDYVMWRISEHGLLTAEPPIVAVNAHSANPHYSIAREANTPIARGDFVLLDLWAREPGTDAIYADFTWTAYADRRVPDEYAQVFAIVAAARDAAVELVQRRVAQRAPVSGRDADRAARDVIERAGYGGQFVHRTGHSIGRDVHGVGANLDSLETYDHRLLIDNTCFSVEPGIYLEGRFGVRSEIDMTIEGGRALVSGEPRQTEIVPLLARYQV